MWEIFQPGMLWGTQTLWLGPRQLSLDSKSQRVFQVLVDPSHLQLRSFPGEPYLETPIAETPAVQPLVHERALRTNVGKSLGDTLSDRASESLLHAPAIQRAHALHWQPSERAQLRLPFPSVHDGVLHPDPPHKRGSYWSLRTYQSWRSLFELPIGSSFYRLRRYLPLNLLRQRTFLLDWNCNVSAISKGSALV